MMMLANAGLSPKPLVVELSAMREIFAWASMYLSMFISMGSIFHDCGCPNSSVKSTQLKNFPALFFPAITSAICCVRRSFSFEISFCISSSVHSGCTSCTWSRMSRQYCEGA